MPETRILLGVIGRPHGVRGLVHVTSHTADPAALAEYGPLSDDKGRRFTLAWRGEGIAEVFELGADAPVRLADREAAGRLTNTRLYIERARLPAPEDDEFYLADLIGLAAVDTAGNALGRVIAVHDYGAGASLEITRDGPPLLVPFTRAAVPEVDLVRGRVIVSVPDEVDVGEKAHVTTTPPPLEGRGAGGGVPQLGSAKRYRGKPLPPTPSLKGRGSIGTMRPRRERQPMTWRATVLTLFPEAFPGPLGLSLAGRALAAGLWSLDAINIRDFATDRHRTVDDTPFGGGAGMVLRPDVIDAALAAVLDPPGTDTRPLLCLTPRGTPFIQSDAAHLAAGQGAILLAGRYEGVDQRVIDARGMREISIGDYVLSGGELPALVVLDACIRLLPGVMGAADSADDESFTADLLEYPHYTRPADWQGHQVPEVLLSGHHAAVAAWRRAEAERITRARRPDLWARYASATHTPPVASGGIAP